MESLRKAMELFIPLTDDLTQSIQTALSFHQYPKSTLLLKPGQTSDRVYFIETGLVRGYYLKNGRDITTGFMREYDFVISPVSFFGRQPSFEYLELLEDTTFYAMTQERLEALYIAFPEFNRVGRLLAEQYYVRSELRAHHLRVHTAEERYELFLTHYAPLLNRITNLHISSFIGLTPETLSRVRAKR